MERRRSPRRLPSRDEPLGRVRLRTGRELEVLTISDVGALVEGGARLLPNTHVDVHLVTRAGRVLVRTRVVRAWVSHVGADVVRYQGALAFERSVDTARGYAIPSSVAAAAVVVGTTYPETNDRVIVPDVDRRTA